MSGHPAAQSSGHIKSTMAPQGQRINSASGVLCELGQWFWDLWPRDAAAVRTAPRQAGGEVKNHSILSLCTPLLLPGPPTGPAQPNTSGLRSLSDAVSGWGQVSSWGSEHADERIAWGRGKWRLHRTATAEIFWKYFIRKILGKRLSLMAREGVEPLSLNIKQHLTLNKKGPYFIPHVYYLWHTNCTWIHLLETCNSDTVFVCTSLLFSLSL